MWCDDENIAAHHLFTSHCNRREIVCRLLREREREMPACLPACAWPIYKILCILFLQLKLLYLRRHVWNGTHLLLWIRKHYPLLESDVNELAALRRNAIRRSHACDPANVQCAPTPRFHFTRTLGAVAQLQHAMFIKCVRCLRAPLRLLFN